MCPTSTHSASTDPKWYLMLRPEARRRTAIPEGRRLKWFWAAFLSAGNEGQQPLTPANRRSESPHAALHPHLRHSFVQRFAEQFVGKSPMPTFPHFLFYRLLFQPKLGHFKYVYISLSFFSLTWPEHAGEASKRLPSDGMQSHAASLPAAAWVH